MLKTKELKLLALYYIDEHDNLTNSEKLMIMKFVKNSSRHQVEHLLLTGRMESNLKDLKEWNDPAIQNYKDIAKAIFQQKGYSQGVSTGIGYGIAATVLTAAAAYAASQVYKNFLSKAAKACKGKTGNEKRNCMAKFKQQAQKEKIATLQKALSMCSKTKKPGTCKDKIQSKINKEKSKYGVL